MTAFRTLVARTAGAATALLFLATLVAPAPPAAAQAASVQEGRADAEKLYWQNLYREAIQAERDAQRAHEKVAMEWKKGRQRNRLRGEKRTIAQSQVERTEAEWEKARQYAREIPERARKAGAPPGWLREVEAD